MKTASSLISLLGAIVICTHIAHAMICFSCENETSNWKCLRMSFCSKEEQRCITIGTVSRTDNSSQVLITKKCAQRCPSEKDYPNRALNSLFCCEHTWCNIRPPK
ncbi:lymphocyte antigen 6E-like [Sceloporus undulatus]|uniref:lymphocyte antigen 6E-like n=1 Tax=Sceloporus undulatus TaxID=8520 RepID=UPI001C4AA97A|nr:lymphocyte antigen 6E-like [Sceloporus undulatus]